MDMDTETLLRQIGNTQPEDNRLRHGYAVLRVSTNAQDEQSQRRDLLRSVCNDVVFDPVLHRVNLTLDYGDFCTHCLVAPTGFVLMGAPSRPVSIGKIDTEYMEVAA